MSKPADPKSPLCFAAAASAPKSFSTEAVAQIAVVVLSQPLSLSTNMSLSSACRIAHNILVAAERFNAERAAALEATEVSECAKTTQV